MVNECLKGFAVYTTGYAMAFFGMGRDTYDFNKLMAYFDKEWEFNRRIHAAGGKSWTVILDAKTGEIHQAYEWREGRYDYLPGCRHMRPVVLGGTQLEDIQRTIRGYIRPAAEVA